MSSRFICKVLVPLVTCNSVMHGHFQEAVKRKLVQVQKQINLLWVTISPDSILLVIPKIDDIWHGGPKAKPLPGTKMT